MTNNLCLFVLASVQQSQGSEPSVDSYYCFLDQETARRFAREKTAGRDTNGPTPAKYTNYEEVGLTPVRAELLRNPAFRTGGVGWLWFEKLGEML